MTGILGSMLPARTARLQAWVGFSMIAGVFGCQRAESTIDFDVSLPSNIAADDYVGPDVCGECHGAKFEQWSGNLHRAMNRTSDELGAVVGDFSGATLHYGGGVARFEFASGAPSMILQSASGRVSTYRVTRTIGSRYIQEYVGVRVSPSPSDTEVRLPFGYWLRERRWFHQQFFDSWFGPEYNADGTLAIDPFEVDSTPWATRCAWCHNTYPFELRQSRAQLESPVGEGPEIFSVHSNPPVVIGNRLPIEQLVTVGISCESCHFGGRDHAAGLPISFGPQSSKLSRREGAPRFAGVRSDAMTINRICAQCHSAPSRAWPSGASMRNSREALDLLDGGCASQIKCTDCHDPHRRGPMAGASTQPAHVTACLRCHGELASEAEIRRHSGHDTASATCIDCHMPRIVQGFSGPLRSHRISSPRVESVVAGTEPDACGLCHLDWSSRQIAEQLAASFGRPAPDVPLSVVFNEPIGKRWLRSDVPIIRATAAAAYGRRFVGNLDVARELASMLEEPIAYYRMRILFALEAVLGREIPPVEFDPKASPGRRTEQSRALMSQLR